MEPISKLLTSLAAILSALAWPGAFLIFIFTFQKEISIAFSKLTSAVDRARKLSWAGLNVELNEVADVEAKSGEDKGGKITQRQIETATRIAIKTEDVETTELLGELDRLCLEYDSIRRSMPPGPDRTTAMTRILVKMRILAPRLVDHLETYRSSGSPGSRLAAVAMMQMVPRVADLDWLLERFSSDQPFVFYHAALALQNVATHASTQEQRARVLTVAKQALHVVESFGSKADQNTISVLQALISDGSE